MRLGFGDGFRDEDFEGIPNLVFPLTTIPFFDSDELVRRCADGKLVILL